MLKVTNIVEEKTRKYIINTIDSDGDHHDLEAMFKFDEKGKEWLCLLGGKIGSLSVDEVDAIGRIIRALNREEEEANAANECLKEASIAGRFVRGSSEEGDEGYDID